jgi:O-antigen/teichoic acid export membrane protein
MISRIFKNNFIRSGAIYSFANFMVSLVGYVLNLIIARTFSLPDYGEYMTAMAYIFFLGVPLGSFGLIVMKRVGAVKAAQREAVALLLENWLFKEIKNNKLLIILLSLVFSLTVYFKGNMNLPSIIFILAFSLLFIFLNFYLSVLQAYKLFFLAGVLTVLAFGSRLILSLGIIAVFPNLILLFSAFLLALLIGVFAGAKFIRRTPHPKKMELHFQKVTTYLKRKSILIPILTMLGLAGLINADVVLVKKFFSGEMAGLYASISLLGKIVFYIAAPLTLVGFSFFTGEDSKHQSGKILLLLTFIIGVLGLGSIGVYALFPSLIIKVIFGEKFLAVSNLVWLAAIFGSLYSLISLYAQYFIARGNKFGLLCLGATGLQALTIYFFHSSLNQVMIINVGICGVLLSLFVGKVVLSFSQNKNF